MAKKLLVKDILNVMPDDLQIDCVFYAYGIHYAQSRNDGMMTVKECKEGLRYDCLNALVASIKTGTTGDGKTVQVVCGEIVH